MSRPPRRRGPARGRSRWAPRCALLSTLFLLACLAAHGPARSLFAFVWACLAVAAFGLEFVARRRPAAGAPCQDPS